MTASHPALGLADVCRASVTISPASSPTLLSTASGHLEPEAKEIAEAWFDVDDATTLFYDWDAFGSVINPEPFMKELIESNALGREVPIGLQPEILYFTGKRQIFSVNTAFGKISALHRPTHNLGGPGGVFLKNTISLEIAFEERVQFEEVISRIVILTSYCGFLVGRPQNVRHVFLRLGEATDPPVILRVYWSMPPKREPVTGTRKPHPADVLLNGGMQPEQFSNVLQSWLYRHETWHDARGRFFTSFFEGRSYSIDRLIGAANMFDILPASAVPRDTDLTNDLKDAQSQAVKLFRPLPPSPERDSVLGALGRMGKRNLKQKIRYRAQNISELVGNRFPDLELVVDEAVNCRNHYVHGGDARIDYSTHAGAVWFFVDTLEFVFGASDLIASGWDIESWSRTPTSGSHPFGQYRLGYATNLQGLTQALV